MIKEKGKLNLCASFFLLFLTLECLTIVPWTGKHCFWFYSIGIRNLDKKIQIVPENWPPRSSYPTVSDHKPSPLSHHLSSSFYLTFGFHTCTAVLRCWVCCDVLPMPVCTVMFMCYVLSPGCRGTLYQIADLKRSPGLTYLNRLYLTSPVSSTQHSSNSG